MRTLRIAMQGLDCADCAAKIERGVQKLEGVKEASINLFTQLLEVETERTMEEILPQVQKITAKYEPDVVVTAYEGHKAAAQKQGSMDGCNCHSHGDGTVCSHETHHHGDYDHEGHHHGDHDHEAEHHHGEACHCKEGHHHHGEECHCEEGHHHGEECHCEEEHHHGEEHHHHGEGCHCEEEHHHGEGHHHHGECCHHHHDHGGEEEIVPHAPMEAKGKMEFSLQGLDCADCAEKIERAVQALPVVADAQVNFMRGTLLVKTDADAVSLLPQIKDVVARYEPDVQVLLRQKETARAAAAKESAKTERRKLFLRFGFGLVFFIIGALLKDSPSMGLLGKVLLICAYITFGYDVLLRAVKNIAKGQVFDENFLMSLSTIGAFAINQWDEAVFVMFFYQVGEAFQDYAVEKSRSSITDLMDIRPDTAHKVVGEDVVTVSPEEVSIGDLILVKAGEKIPLDGTVVKGSANLDTMALTGESVPRKVEAGSQVFSGYVNEDGTLTIQVTKAFGDSTVMQILEMVENAAGKKSKTEQFITRFARVYTPAVVGAAVAVAVLPPLFGFGAFWDWFGKALIFLVVSCPCALVLSVPLSYFAGIGAASKEGVLIKGSNYLDVLSSLNRVVMDKTGTLTEGVFQVTEISAQQPEELLQLAANGEAMSTHPIAKAIVKKAQEDGLQIHAVTDGKEIGGHGIVYGTGDEQVLLGNDKLMQEHGISVPEYDGIGTVVYVAQGGTYLGYLAVSDIIRSNAAEALAELKAKGVERVVMLTGDREKSAGAVAKKLGIDEYHAELLPQDKVSVLQQILEENAEGKTAFIGDGINDAPVLAAADVGIAMGAIGSDAAIEAADVVLMRDDLGRLAEGIRIARKTKVIVHQNIVFALGVKILVMILSVFGAANMWMAVFADVGVAVIAILNAMRAR